MSGYIQSNDPFRQPNDRNQFSGDTYGPQPTYETDFNTLQQQQLDFQSFSVSSNEPVQFDSNQSQFMYNAPMPGYMPNIFTPSPDTDAFENVDNEFDEPPLLDELEIYPQRIFAKTLAVLNPFHKQSDVDDPEFLTKDTDLAGPIAFCLVLAVCLFLSGEKAHFGYIYGLCMISCVAMYCLLSLMSPTSGVFTLVCVASILGYSLLPIVALSVIGIFISLNNLAGFGLGIVAVLWASISAARLFVAISGDGSQKPLIAYPCALVNGVFALLVIF